MDASEIEAQWTGPALLSCSNGHGWAADPEWGDRCPVCGDSGTPVEAPKRGNKYHARREWSDICQREFASSLERRRGEYLYGLATQAAIYELRFQVRYELNPGNKPLVTYVADFVYWMWDDYAERRYVIEDTKGVLTSASRVKLAWMAANGNPVTVVKDGDW